MKRRGFISIEVMILLLLGLLVAGGLIWAYQTRAFPALVKPFSCGTPDQGYICRSSCDAELGLTDTFKSVGCADQDIGLSGYACCYAVTDTAKAKLKARDYLDGIPTSISGKTDPAKAPSTVRPQPPTITISRGGFTELRNDQTVVLTSSGTAGDRASKFTLGVKTTATSPCRFGTVRIESSKTAIDKSKETASGEISRADSELDGDAWSSPQTLGSTKDDSCHDWTVQVALEDGEFRDISHACLVLKDGVTCDASDKTSQKTKQISDEASKQLKEDGVAEVDFDVLSDDDYIGRKIHLIVRVFPGDDWGAHPDLRKEFSLQFEFKPSIRYGGLTPTWSKSKTIGIECVDPAICGDVLIGIRGDGFYETPGEEELARSCKLSADMTAVRLKTAPSLKVARQVFCITNGVTVAPGTCAESLEACRKTLDTSYRNTDYQQLTSQIMQAVGTAGNKGAVSAANQQLLTMWSTIESEAALWDCQPSSAGIADLETIYAQPDNQPMPHDPGAVLTAGTSVGTAPGGTATPVKMETVFFKVDTFDQGTQKGSVVLDQAFMNNAYLCVYGIDRTNDAIYSAGIGRQIKIDTLPPQGKIEFNPWTLKLRFSCQDAGSDCKDAVGVRYISDVTAFLPALFSGNANARQFCPPANAGYSSETRKEIFYDGEALRVLCLKVEDKAGNTAITMAKVYNSYDLIAGAIAMYNQERDK